jgi:hypothetical protein
VQQNDAAAKESAAIGEEINTRAAELENLLIEFKSNNAN